MDPKVKLLKEFYSSMQKDKLKLETTRCGFDFLDQIVSDGIVLEYGELASSCLIHKYRLLNMPEERMDQLLQMHVLKECNVCLYFDQNANQTFCFNLDNNHKDNNTALIPEMKLALQKLSAYLEELGIEPLIIGSGRGYHLWCRVAGLINNQRLYDFMLRMVAKTLAAIHETGADYNQIKINMYPNYKIINTGSLRLFGSEHIRNKVFSFVHTKSGMLDEADSWQYFADYMNHKTVSLDQFGHAYDELMAYFEKANIAI